MDKLIFLLPILLISLPLNGQTPTPPATAMTVTPVTDIERLVRDVFIKEGDCAKVSNIRLIGRQDGVGAFEVEAGAISVGIGSGLILSSGDVKDVVGPNEMNNTTSSGELNSSDTDLRRLSGQQVFDATGIEFDFVPTSSEVSFNYVFASEEYCEFVNQEFNDVFGFFVSGPGLNGKFDQQAINIALIPTTQERVAINSVNHLRNSQYFIANFLEKDIRECNLPPRLEPLRDVEFDGFTTRLRATVEVIPCETYHIRLVVGDVADNILDSGVFLEANSFDLGENIGVSAEVINSDGNTLFENCLEGNFVFERRTLVDRARPLTVNYRVEGEAINGTDFEMIPNQVVIPVGQRFARVPIKGIVDDLPEGTEKIQVITELASCDCIERDTAFLFISDGNEGLTLDFDDELACAEEPFVLRPRVENAIQPIQYRWSTGDTTESILSSITAPTDYELTITDACGGVQSSTARVALQPKPQATLSGEAAWCFGATGLTLPVSLEGNPPWALTYRNGVDSVFRVANIMQNPFRLPVDAAGAYELLTFRDKNCTGTVAGVGQVANKAFEVDYELTAPSCRTANDGEIQLQIQNGLPPYRVDWGALTGDSLRLTSVGVGSYQAVVMDAEGCIAVVDILIPEASIRENCPFRKNSIYIPNAFSPNGDAVNDLFQVYPRLGSFKAVSFQVYDRWGGRLFSSDPFLSARSGIGWDGGTAPTGVYLCQVQVVLSDGRVETLAQSFQLMR